jgi:hypothetical protein
MKKILFIVPDSTGIRNYLYSDIFKYLKGKVDIQIWSPLPIQIFDRIRDLHDLEFDFISLRLPKENIFSRWIRETTTFARLQWNTKTVDNKTILNYWNYKSDGVFLKYLFRKSNILIGSIISSNYYIITSLEKLGRSFWSKNIIQEYEDLLQKNKIDKIFITHQRVTSLAPICIAAKNVGIEVITVIYSWDNLPKARLNVVADKYLVWSEHMKQEMAIFYPEIHQDKIIIAGTPQFEFYYNNSLAVSRSEFANNYGLNPNKKWILYSGGDTLTSPYDQDFLNDLADALSIESDIQIIFRRSPADYSSRFSTVIDNYPNKIFSIDPLWEIGEDWSSNIPLFDDFMVLKNLASHCELAVNVGSTIAHDFAIFNKPTIYVNYNQDDSATWSIKTINAFQHFRSMPSKNAVIWVYHKNEWLKKINEAINFPENVAVDRLIWFEKINCQIKPSSSKKIANIILK